MDSKDPFKDFDKNFDRAWKFGKYAIGLYIFAMTAFVGLVGWIIFHFISKWW